MNLKQYTLISALACKDKDIENWIHNFLCGEGNNKPFSDGLKLFDRHYIGPIKMPLNMFERCCGFEEKMKFAISKKGFETNVNTMISAIKNGWDVPPLIINY
ncbi:hypothetical protein IMX26_15510 [Clostridium sp. 'deep sea']|uniref:hypothetical protein n=1 Tax=Clostridium sp. 'deep sea' TaxID=2779445 RepID=UPI00189679F6|nr:hypothetical protein [Clostridium sp. 'deep sea']QOR34848.1 hypothetical protein IMX26_15510 [Clostridium sp. 'deep sea']